MKIHKTLIIGGGIAGLGCARTLCEGGDHDFCLLTKDIGGRITTSDNGQVNYGAFYVRKDYTHVLPFMRTTKRMKVWSTKYVENGKAFTAMHTIVRHPFLSVRLACLVLRFNRDYQAFKKLAAQMQQADAMAQLPHFQSLHHVNAHAYFQEHGYRPLLERVINPLARITGFVDARQVSVGDVLRSLLIFWYPTHEFIFMKEKLIAPFFQRIIRDEVISIHKENSHWKVRTQSGASYCGKNVVVATPIHISARLLNIRKGINTPVSVHMAHVRGQLREKYAKADYIILPIGGADICIACEPDATFLFYSHSKDYDLSLYFTEYEIIKKKYWHPALYFGYNMLKSYIDTGLYLIGDHNFLGIEDSFITGIYAANQILSRGSK